MKIYVAGPMRGIRDFNFPAFFEAETVLSELGYEVCNPAREDVDKHGPDVYKSETGDLADIAHLGFDLRQSLGWDLAWISQHADAVCVLPGWEQSSGARAEVATALALGLKVALLDTFLPGTEPQWITDIPSSRQPATGEVRTTSSTGGEKGVKPARYDLIPVIPLDTLARVYGRGAEKYEDYNWAKGYEWSKSFAAMQRHAWAFWAGEDLDPELQLPHLASVAWHAFTLMHFMTFEKYQAFDDRYELP